MNYKKEIISMIQKIESVRFLAMIYSFTHTLFEKEPMGVLTMNYKKETVEMLNKIQSEKVLRYIWIFVSDICKDIGIKTNE